MKLNLFQAILSVSLYLSCSQPLQEDPVRAAIDKVKRESISNKDFSVSTYSFDSSTYWEINSQITSRQQAGVRSTLVYTEFKQGGKLVKAVSNDMTQTNRFLGQTITTDLPGKIVLCYLMEDEQKLPAVFKISCKTNGEFLIEKLDPATSKEAAETKSSILHKNQSPGF